MYIDKHPTNPDIAQTAPWKKTVQKANPTTTRKAIVDNKIHFVETIGLLESTAEYGECIALASSRMGGMGLHGCNQYIYMLLPLKIYSQFLGSMIEFQ